MISWFKLCNCNKLFHYKLNSIYKAKKVKSENTERFWHLVIFKVGKTHPLIVYGLLYFAKRNETK